MSDLYKIIICKADGSEVLETCYTTDSPGAVMTTIEFRHETWGTEEDYNEEMGERAAEDEDEDDYSDEEEEEEE